MDQNQMKSIKSWTEQRDALLKDISILSSTKNNLIEETKVIGFNKADLQEQVALHKGRLLEVQESEDLRKTVISSELSDLIVKKSEAENVLKTVQDDVVSLQEKKTLLLKDLEVLLPTYERIAFQIGALNETVNNVVRVNQENTKDFNVLIYNVSNILRDLVAEIKQTEGVLGEIKNTTTLNNESANNLNSSVGIITNKIKEIK